MGANNCKDEGGCDLLCISVLLARVVYMKNVVRPFHFDYC